MEENFYSAKIRAGRIPIKRTYKEESEVAFKYMKPRPQYHFWFIPRRHSASMADLTLEDGPILAKIFITATKLAHDRGIDESGYRIVANVGPDAGQSVFHLHFHLLGGRKLGWPPG